MPHNCKREKEKQITEIKVRSGSFTTEILKAISVFSVATQCHVSDFLFSVFLTMSLFVQQMQVTLSPFRRLCLWCLAEQVM